MNQKIVGVIPLMVAMLFVAVFALGDNTVAADNPVQQTANLTVAQVISISTDSNVDLGTTSGTAAQTLNSPSYHVNNDGNVKINLYIHANDSNGFTQAGGNQTIPLAGYTIDDNSANPVNIGTGYSLIYGNMAKGPNSFLDTKQHLIVPAFTEAGPYSISLTYTAVRYPGTLP